MSDRSVLGAYVRIASMRATKQMGIFQQSHIGNIIMDERRRHPRLDTDLPVTLRCGGRLVPATALNISCGGMCIRAEGGAIPENASVEIVFDLGEEGRDLSLCGQITRLSEGEGNSTIGVQFTNVFSISHKAIQEYLRKNLN